MKYYYPENIVRYKKLKAEGEKAGNETHGAVGFENFCSRDFLEEALPRLRFSTRRPTALEYGCGTGPGACFMAARGFQVDAIDIIPAAIEMARGEAGKRGLDVHYEVMDICELPHEGRKYDMIVDSYCLQHIVTDADRESVFAAVRARLKPEGYYLVSTAVFDESRLRKERVEDRETGVTYNKYGADGLIDTTTGVVLQRLDGEPGDYKDAVRIGKAWYLPNRRHVKAPRLRAELEEARFSVLYQGGEYGENVICVLKGSGACLAS